MQVSCSMTLGSALRQRCCVCRSDSSPPAAAGDWSTLRDSLILPSVGRGRSTSPERTEHTHEETCRVQRSDGCGCFQLHLDLLADLQSQSAGVFDLENTYIQAVLISSTKTTTTNICQRTFFSVTKTRR